MGTTLIEGGCDGTPVQDIDTSLALDEIPRYVKNEGPVTVRDCVEEVVLPEGDPSSTDIKVIVSVKASDVVWDVLEWLVDQGYSEKTKGENGKIEYYPTEKLEKL